MNPPPITVNYALPLLLLQKNQNATHFPPPRWEHVLIVLLCFVSTACVAAAIWLGW